MTDLQRLVADKIDWGEQKTRALIETSTLGSGFKRDAYRELEATTNSFIASSIPQSHWTIITGLRGVGKTTLLAQLYQQPTLSDYKKFYLSLDEFYQMGVTIEDIVSVIQDRLGNKLMTNQEPVFVFLDEVHFLPHWSTGVKVLYDNSRRLCLVCTGSSAISFWTNPDIGRRARMISLPPLSLREFSKIESLYSQKDKPDLGQTSKVSRSEQLKEILFGSSSEQEIFSKLKRIKTLEFSDKQVYDYVNFYGSMPFVATIKHSGPKTKDRNESQIRDLILQTINTFSMRDLDVLSNFDAGTKSKFMRLLLLLANDNSTSLRKIAKNLELNTLTATNMLRALSDGEIVTSIAPLGSSFGKISKSYKYLFASPALRQALSSTKLDLKTHEESANLRGSLLEDSVGMYLKRLFVSQPLKGILEYDANQGGADFIVMPRGLRSEATILEVGWGKNRADQVLKTRRQLKKAKGLVVTDGPLRFDDQNKVVFVPLALFFEL